MHSITKSSSCLLVFTPTGAESVALKCIGTSISSLDGMHYTSSLGGSQIAIALKRQFPPHQGAGPGEHVLYALALVRSWIAFQFCCICGC